jgi:hypothetical protein
MHDAFLMEHLGTLKSETLRTLLESGAWDTITVGGEEVDIDILYRPDRPASPGVPAVPVVQQAPVPAAHPEDPRVVA